MPTDVKIVISDDTDDVAFVALSVGYVAAVDAT